MPKIPEGAKAPQDHKTKTPDGVFSFEHAGATYVTTPLADVITPGFIRRNRNNEAIDITYTALEQLCDEETLAVLDNMTFAEHTQVIKAFDKAIEAYMGVALGE